jgi:hypothetical protein
VADKASYLSRLTVKLIEVIGAGIATAVSGYLVAHLGGFMLSQPPAKPPAVQAAPSAAEAAPTAAASAATASPQAQPPTASVSTDAGEQHTAPASDAPPAVAPPRRNQASAASSRKHATAEPREAESKREKEDLESVEARVRAALANVDASRPPPQQPQALPRQADNPPPQPLTPPRQADNPPPTVAAAPREAAASPQLQPLPEPLGAVEIKSRPVADVATVSASQDDASARDNPHEEHGLFAAIKRIPDLLRGDAPVALNPDAPSQPPRPPLPVSE